MSKKVLYLPVKQKYFDAIRSLKKKEEYRLASDYWSKRIEGKSFDEVRITLGYPKKGDMQRIIVRPWRGCSKKLLKHEHFGSEAVEVFAIIVN